MPLYICWRVLERPRHKRLTANPIKVEGRGFCIRREKLVAVLLKMIDHQAGGHYCFHTHLCPLFSQGQRLPFPTGLPSSPFCSPCSISLPSPTTGGELFSSDSAWYSPVHLSTPSTFHLFAIRIRKSLPPPSVSFSFVISFMSGDVNVFTRRCLHTAVSCNHCHFPPTVPAYLTVKCLEEGQCGEKTQHRQHRLRSSSVMLTSKKVKQIITSAVAHLQRVTHGGQCTRD